METGCISCLLLLLYCFIVLFVCLLFIVFIVTLIVYCYVYIVIVVLFIIVCYLMLLLLYCLLLCLFARSVCQARHVANVLLCPQLRLIHIHQLFKFRIPYTCFESDAASIDWWICLRPVHLLRVSLLRVLESNFPGDSL